MERVQQGFRIPYNIHFNFYNVDFQLCSERTHLPICAVTKMSAVFNCFLMRGMSQNKITQWVGVDRCAWFQLQV